jgi:HEPN domain-containing protein
MNKVIEEWIFKAEGDFTTAERELSVTVAPNFDAVCFHAQQCAEKYLKALLIVRGVTPPKIHDLAQLHRLLD